jgi:excisionase family DNA binding protein
MNGNISIGRSSFTVNEIAIRNSVHVSTVNRWIASGRLRSTKIGKLRRITVEQERAFLKLHTR